jgi:5-methylcytosine-specific restriction endonuclease McrA
MPKHRASTPYHDRRWKPLRIRILKRDMGICQIQGDRCTGTGTEADHIIGWRDGGAWFDPANLRAACKPCNSQRKRLIRVDTTINDTPSRNW